MIQVTPAGSKAKQGRSHLRMAGDCSSSYVPFHMVIGSVPGRPHRAARRRTAQRDDRTNGEIRWTECGL